MIPKCLKDHRLTYWVCQIFGWGGVAFFGRIMESLQSLASPLGVQAQNHGFLTLTCLAGLIASHFLRLIIVRGRWLEMTPGKLIVRYSAALAILTLMLSVIGMTYFKSSSSLDGRIEAFTIVLMINSSLMGAWMAIYFLFHFYEALHRVRQQQVLLNEAVMLSQLEALRLQLNPHFLFNALNSIRALIPATSGEAREGVTRLAGVLRSTLGQKKEKTAPFDNEMELVRDYLAIEKLRFGEHLLVVEELDVRLHQVNIPPLLLLTIVENAIKHGVQSQEQPATITIRGSVEDDEVLIIVESPGSNKKADPDGSLGIGLRNVRERLQLIYGERATAILSFDDSLTRCLLRYPLYSLSSL